MARRYWVRRIGSAVLVVPAGDPDTSSAGRYGRALEPFVRDLPALGDPVVLGQAVEAGYYDADEQHVSNDDADAGP